MKSYEPWLETCLGLSHSVLGSNCRHWVRNMNGMSGRHVVGVLVGSWCLVMSTDTLFTPFCLSLVRSGVDAVTSLSTIVYSLSLPRYDEQPDKPALQYD
jgi:hypothetical protein